MQGFQKCSAVLVYYFYDRCMGFQNLVPGLESGSRSQVYST